MSGSSWLRWSDLNPRVPLPFAAGDRWQLTERNGAYRLEEDMMFKSLSAAALVRVGGRSNGREAWRDADGVSLKEHQTLAAGPADES